METKGGKTFLPQSYEQYLSQKKKYGKLNNQIKEQK
jgi:hypothetical protein